MYEKFAYAFLLALYILVCMLSGDDLFDALLSLLSTYVGNLVLVLSLVKQPRDFLLALVVICAYRLADVAVNTVRQFHFDNAPLETWRRWGGSFLKLVW